MMYELVLSGATNSSLIAAPRTDATFAAMHGAAYKMLPKVVELLDKRDVNIKLWAKKSKQGRTPLSIAHGVTPPPPPKKRDESWRN